MDLKTQLETVAKNHQASIQNLETKFDRLANKQSGRPSGSLPSNTQPNPKGHNSKAYEPPQSRNEHVNAIFTRSGFVHTSVDLKFRNRVFQHKVGLVVTNLDVIGVIEDEVMFGNLCDEDSVRLCLILDLEVIFMGRLLACPVDDSLFRLVENLEAWNVFPWGEHAWTQLYDSIKNVLVKHSDTHYLGLKKDHNYVPTYTLTGFVFAFQ
ncbi:hypothetical protein Tco_1286841, partial [Tanacetum coccineum]